MTDSRSISMANKTNWLKLFAITAAAAGLGAFAVYYMKRLKAGASISDKAIDDVIDFCRSRVSELETILTETEQAHSN